jgi:hypothetical protein
LQEWCNDKDVLGIDLQPQPCFVRCSHQAIEELNKKVKQQIQEVLGILDGYNPQEEVVIIVITQKKIKLINFKPKLLIPIFFEDVSSSLDALINNSEKLMIKQLNQCQL